MFGSVHAHSVDRRTVSSPRPLAALTCDCGRVPKFPDPQQTSATTVLRPKIYQAATDARKIAR